MYIKIQTSEKANGNKGSVNALASYLEKEDIARENAAFEKGELPEARTGFFNHSKNGIFKNEVISKIDSNKKSLGKVDAKFYAITLSPSKNEQKHLLKICTNKQINSIDDLTSKERKAYEKLLVDYTRKSMNEYATHFGRNDLKSGSQLVYFAKIEHERFYKGTDIDVKSKFKKSNEKKAGLQTHIHIIMSRKDIEQRFKLSPLAQEKTGKNAKLNNRKVKRGFDRNLFNIKAEAVFDKNFNYQRALNEKLEYRIEAYKNPIKALEIERTMTPNSKRALQQELINQYDLRNSYNIESKSITHNIQPIIEHKKDNDLSI